MIIMLYREVLFNMKYLKNNPEMLIPYALFATFEMAPDCGVDVYQKVVDKVQVKNAIKTV